MLVKYIKRKIYQLFVNFIIVSKQGGLFTPYVNCVCLVYKRTSLGGHSSPNSAGFLEGFLVIDGDCQGLGVTREP